MVQRWYYYRWSLGSVKPLPLIFLKKMVIAYS